MDALVSVIIPVYNVSPYLREALDSVIHQTYKNLEILIIDDGSTDESGRICDEYLSDPRVIVIHQENKGLSGARNTGLNHMTGEFVAFLDPDDAYDPDMISILLKVLLQKEADFSVCNYTNVESEGSLKHAKKGFTINMQKILIYSARKALIAILENSFSVAVWDKLYRKQLWEQLRFPEGHVYEDMMIIPSILEKCECIVSISQILVYHRKRIGSITQTDTEKNIQDYLNAFQIILSYAEKLQPPPSSNSIEMFREKKLRELIFKYAELSKSNTLSNSPDIFNTSTERIHILSSSGTEFQNMKTKVVWWFYQHFPRALIFMRNIFRCMKLFLRQSK